MSLLAIDTSIGTSVALAAHDRVVASAGSADERGHTEVIGSLIAQLFAETGTSPSDVEGVVVGIGPGPFTGLRVGIAAAKAFATGLGVPLLPISGHEAVAENALNDDIAKPDTGARVLQDAKRRELFVTEYFGRDEAGLPKRVEGPYLLARADYVEEARDVWPEAIDASTLLWLAQVRLRSGRAFEPDQALYLRSPDVYPSAGPKRVSV